MKDINQVPFFPYSRLFTNHQEKYLEIINDVLSRGAFILQKDLSDFETKLADFLGVKHAIGVSDCTNGLFAGLLAAGISSGDEVIFPSHTFVASAGAIKLAGAKPIPCDINLNDGMMNPADIERHITQHTKAIMPVQLNGRTCNMDAIASVAEEYGLIIVEDSAQALGSSYKGKNAGTFGLFGAFSFYPAKTLGCFGDGGAVVTNDDLIADSVRLFRNHGRANETDISGWGGNSRLDNVQAAFLNFQLLRYETTIERRREIASKYQSSFSAISDLKLPPGPDNSGDNFDIFQNYELKSNHRDELRSYLSEQGIETMIQWGGKAVHQHQNLGLSMALPGVESYFKECMLLPMNSLMTNNEVDYVCESIKTFYDI